MSLETEVKSFIGVRPISYFEVEGACAYDDSDPFADPSKGSRQEFFSDAYAMAMIDYYHKGQAKTFAADVAKDVTVAVLIRITDKHERTELVHLRLLSDAYFAIPKLEHFAEAVVRPNTRRLSNECRKLKPAANLEKCEAVVFETTLAEFCKIVRSVGGANTVKTVEILGSFDGHITANRRLDETKEFDLALMKFIFGWNLKVDGLSDEEIAEKWKQTPWSTVEDK